MKEKRTAAERDRKRENDEVDEASIESFPASDAPSFTPVTHAGRPSHEKEEGKGEEQRGEKAEKRKG